MSPPRAKNTAKGIASTASTAKSGASQPPNEKTPLEKIYALRKRQKKLNDDLEAILPFIRSDGKKAFHSTCGHMLSADSGFEKLQEHVDNGQGEFPEMSDV